MANRYWIGGTGTWDSSSTTHWSASSGGLGGASVPGASDDVFIDNNCAALNGTLITISGYTAEINSLSFANLDKTVTVKVDPTAALQVDGSYTGSGWATITKDDLSTPIVFMPTTAVTFSQSGTHLSAHINFEPMGTGSVTLTDNILMDEGFKVEINGDAGATFDADGYNLTAMTFEMGGASATIYMRDGTWTAKYQSNAYWTAMNIGTSVNISCGTSKLIVDASSYAYTGAANEIQFYSAGGTNVFHDFEFKGNATNDFILTFRGGGTVKFTDFSVTGDYASVAFSEEYDAMICSTFTANGSAGKLYTLRSVGSGYQAVLSCVVTSITYAKVKDLYAKGGIPFRDYPGGVDQGNNTNWCFSEECGGLYLQTVNLVGSETGGTVQNVNTGKSDNGTPINYEVETQGIEFGNVFHRKKISDKLVLFEKNGVDSAVQVKADDGDYHDVDVRASSPVNISKSVTVEGNDIRFKWFGETDKASPVLEGFYVENVTDMGETKG